MRGVQHYVMKFVSDLRQVGGFLRVLRFSPPIELTSGRQDITELLLKVALSTFKQTNKQINALCIFPRGSICVQMIVAKDMLSLSRIKVYTIFVINFIICESEAFY